MPSWSVEDSKHREQRREKEKLKAKKSTSRFGASVSPSDYSKGPSWFPWLQPLWVHASGDQDGRARTWSPQLAAEQSSADSTKEQLPWAVGLPTLSPRLWGSSPCLYLML